MEKRSNSDHSSAYTPNMETPSSSRKSKRGVWGLVLTLLCPPAGLAFLWRRGVFRTRGTSGSLLYMIGAILFTASDIILIFNTFTKDGKAWMRPTNLILYYLGQLLIALSIQTM